MSLMRYITEATFNLHYHLSVSDWIILIGLANQNYRAYSLRIRVKPPIPHVSHNLQFLLHDADAL